MENSCAGITSSSYGGTTRFLPSSQSLARPCAQHHRPQHQRTQVHTCNAVFSLQRLSRKHCRRRPTGRKATTCIAAPEIAERTFADGKVRKVCVTGCVAATSVAAPLFVLTLYSARDAAGEDCCLACCRCSLVTSGTSPSSLTSIMGSPPWQTAS